MSGPDLTPERRRGLGWRELPSGVLATLGWSLRRGRSPTAMTIVSSLLLLAGLGFGIGWFTTAPHISRALQTIGMLVFCGATGVTVWLLRKSSPIGLGTGFGALYVAVAMAGWTCGGHAGAFVATGNMKPLGMILIGILIYGLSGAFLGAVGGFVIGAGVWFVGKIQSVGDDGRDQKQLDEVVNSPDAESSPFELSRSVSSVEVTYTKVAAIIVGLFYATSLFLPALPTPGGYNEAQLGLSETNYGISMLIIGLGACLGLNPVWFANPLIWIGAWLLVRRQWIKAGVLGLLAAICAACGPLLVRGSNNTLLIGYYVWLGSAVALAVSGAVGQGLFRPHKLHAKPLA